MKIASAPEHACLILFVRGGARLASFAHIGFAFVQCAQFGGGRVNVDEQSARVRFECA